MTAPSFPLDANTVRDYMSLEVDGTSRYSDTTIGSNMRTALAMIERRAGRFFGGRTQDFRITTNGEASVTIPGLRTAGAINLAGSPLTVDETYWLIPDKQQTGVFTGIQLRGFNTRSDGPWWLSSPEWFDRNLDHPLYPANRGGGSSIPGDLSFTGSTWGYADADMPPDALMAVKVLTAWLTKLADTNYAGILATPDGNAFDLSNWPPFVQEFIAAWGLTGNRVAAT